MNNIDIKMLVLMSLNLLLHTADFLNWIEWYLGSSPSRPDAAGL